MRCDICCSLIGNEDPVVGLVMIESVEASTDYGKVIKNLKLCKQCSLVGLRSLNAGFGITEGGAFDG